ncbi:MAG: hypothetical protein HY591_01095, partial [Candidatus Omnitrophica bacterium]|nr:hypothetical protein [Candidatus Omnitrophota bacterium]
MNTWFKHFGVFIIGLFWVHTAGWTQDVVIPLSIPIKSQDQVADLQKKLEARKTALEDLSIKNAKLEQELFDMVSGDFQPQAKEVLEKHFEDEKTKLEDQIAGLKEKLARAKQPLQVKIDQLARDLDKKDLELKGIREQRDQAQKSLSVSESDRTAKDKRISELLAATGQVPFKINEAKQPLEKRIDELTGSVSEKEKQIAQLRQGIDKTGKDLTAMAKEKRELEQVLQQTQESIPVKISET